MPQSELEDIMAQAIEDAGLPAPQRQYRFHVTRKWRFDFAWPAQRLAVEVDGGQFVMGRHGRGGALNAESEKLEAALLLGWRVYKVPTKWVRDRKGAPVRRETIEAIRSLLVLAP